MLKDFHNIECRDAMLAYDRVEYEVDQHDRPVTRRERFGVTGVLASSVVRCP